MEGTWCHIAIQSNNLAKVSNTQLRRQPLQPSHGSTPPAPVTLTSQWKYLPWSWTFHTRGGWVWQSHRQGKQVKHGLTPGATTSCVMTPSAHMQRRTNCWPEASQLTMIINNLIYSSTPLITSGFKTSWSLTVYSQANGPRTGFFLHP